MFCFYVVAALIISALIWIYTDSYHPEDAELD